MSDYSVPLAPVNIVEPDGRVSGYGLGAASDAERGDALLAAVADLESGDALLLEPGVFDVGNVDIGALPSQISMRGAGINTTKITSAWTGDNAILRPGTDSNFADFWVEENLTDGTKQTAFGWRQSGPSLADVELRGVRMTAEAYGMQAGVFTQAAEYRLYSCELIAKFVAFQCNQPSMDFETYDCLFAARGPHDFEDTYNVGFFNDNGQARSFNCRIEALDGPNDSFACWQQGAASNNTFTELYGCALRSGGASVNNLDLVQGGGTRGPLSVDAGTRYDASKTTGTTGKITRLAGPFGIGQDVQSSTVNSNVQINFTTYSHHVLTIQANIQISLTSLVSEMARRVTLEIVQDGTGGRVPTWGGTNIRFPGGVAPTLSTGANDVDVLEFIWNGTKFTLTNVSLDVQ